MVMSNGLLRIFWPSDLPRTKAPGVLVGWRNSEYDIFVLSILQDVEVRSVENALRMGTLYRNSPHPLVRILSLCGRQTMNVLGSVNNAEEPKTFTLQHIFAFTEPGSRHPQIYCPKETGVSIQVISFERPLPTHMQYMSLRPISLALGDKTVWTDRNYDPIDELDADEEAEKARVAKLVDKLRLHSVARHGPSPKETTLALILNQINCSYEMGELLQKNIGLVGTRPKRSMSVGEKVVESATTLWGILVLAICHIFSNWIYPVITEGFIILLICHRFLAEIVLQILEWRIRPDGAALKDISATAQQIDMRLQQFCYWPIQYLTLRKRKDDWDSATRSHSDYIRFYNSLWLVANDVIIGIALGAYIMENATYVADQINTILNDWTVDGLQRMITWLMDWPAGLKLNNELASFLGDLFLWVIDYWSGCVASVGPFLPRLIYYIGVTSLAGASMPIGLFSDLVTVLTLHIYCFYIASARIFNWQLTIIFSLFQLFRGKKRNVLRNRIDSCDYDLDQLLLGTILFTLLFFLLPTVMVFYLTFASARMAIISLKAGLDTLLACLNHFPLFAMMLRVKDARRLPGGINFELRDTHNSVASSPSQKASSPVAYIYLSSVPLSLSAMFDQYFQLGHRLRKHYLSPSVILCLMSGRFVPPIHRKTLYSLQYSMLPAKRAGILEVWTRLKEKPKAPPARMGLGTALGSIVPDGFGTTIRRR